MKKLYKIAFLLTCLYGLQVHAQEHFVDGIDWGKYYDPVAPDNTFDLEDQYFQCQTASSPNCPYSFEIESSKLYTKLYFDNSLRNYYGADWSIIITYDIDLYTYSSGSSVANSYTGKTLEINYHPTNNYKDIDLEVFSISGNNYTKAVVVIQNINIVDNNTSATAQLNNRVPDDVHFDINLEIDRIYTLNPNQKPRVNRNYSGAFDNTTNEYTISWDFLPGAKEYDVEWLFVDIGNNAQTDEFYIDFRNATRVTTQQHYYDISMAYPRGFLIYRVRGVGYEKASASSLTFDKRVEGAWSFNERSFYKQQASNSVHLRKVPGGVPECSTFFFYNGLETDKNWQYNVVYAEDGKRKEVINFYDGILKPTQTATILNTDESAVIAQPIYDFIGRSSLQVLPAPQQSRGIRFYNPLHRNTLGDIYDYEDFDLDTNIVEPDKLSPNGNLGAGHYYSNQNTNPQGVNGAYIPDAQGYPFSRTIYKNDGSGRVKAVSGVGKEYFGDSGKMQHETKFLYGSPFQEELFMLFGNNVGFAEYYEKTVAIDANGQASAAIKDLSGRVVATSLAGDAPDNLLDIDTKPDNPISLRVHLDDLNEIADESLIVNKTLIAVGQTTYEFNYQIDQAYFNNCGVNTQCVYDLEIYLLDEYGNPVPIDYKGMEVDRVVNNGITNTLSGPYNFSATVSAGSYQIVKQLTLNQDALDNAVINWKENQTCIEKRIVDPIESCNPGCEDLCEESFMTPKDKYGVQYYITDTGTHVAKVENGTVTTILDNTAYQNVLLQIQDCKDKCEDYDPEAPLYSECELKLLILKQDMSPGGQYFDNLPDMYLSDNVTLNPSYDSNGWLESLGQTVRNRIINCINIEYQHNYWDFLRDNWDESYADILVEFHPEYCVYQFQCCGTSTCNQDVVCVNNSQPNTTCAINMNTDVMYTSTASCDPLTSVEKSEITNLMSGIDFRQMEIDALAEMDSSGITDPDIRDEVSEANLRQRAQKYFEEYFIYQRTKLFCCNFPLESPDDSGFTSTGFGIRYPENFAFESFDPCDPTSIEDNLKQDYSCEKQAIEFAENFIARLKSRCDVLTPSQERQLWQFAKESYEKDCEDPLVSANLNQEIRDFIGCTSMLPEACFVEALPEQTDESCACAKINDFVVSVHQADEPSRTYIDIVSDLNSARTQNVQDALDIVLDPTETGLKPNFAKWFAECNNPPHYSWAGGNPVPPYQLAEYFSCEDAEDSGTTSDPDQDCVTQVNAYAQAIADAEFERLLNQKAQEYRQAYINHCLSRAQNTESFTMDYDYNEYHYTLYYYDQAGDLVATVPPDGIFQKDSQTGDVYHDSRILSTTQHQKAMDYLNNRNPSDFVDTQHLMITNYQYNSLQNVITQHTPDGGESKFWYDGLGRVAVSQNANQKTRNAFSYLQYDPLGRTVEAGELVSTNPMTKSIAEDIVDYNIPGGSNQLLNWLNNRNATNEKTTSFYDDVDAAIVNASHPAYQEQHYLRNRISAVAYDNNGDNTYDAITHYNYDVLGNVETLWQENKEIPLVQHRVKRLDYTYDLVSGNVNQVSYQKGKDDQFMHHYSYDADNRLVKVKTSVDDLIWDTDARYFYYAHGPLAREEIGDKIVFANDYIYDIRGWITAMNASMVDAKRDAGKDGIKGGLNENIGRDPFAFSLHYFKDHYQPISSSSSSVIAQDFSAINSLSPIQSADTKPLYNGNISMMVTSLKDLSQNPIEVMANAYRYDQLNRIKSFKPFWDQNSNQPLADNAFTSANSRNESEFYNANYWFDGNGNIERLKRNSISSTSLPNEKMDDMAYTYNKVTTPVSLPTATTTIDAKVNNQLFQVKDDITTTGYDIDIESGQTAKNYKYDEIGRLISDSQENIQQINWNVSNKVTSFEKSTMDDDVFFAYGPMGNRIGKFIKKKSSIGVYDPTKEVQTFYMLDAQGNPIAIYKYDADTNTLTIEDFIIYGNKRLGTNTKSIEMN